MRSQSLFNRRVKAKRKALSGFSLIELMVALVLGTLVVLATTGIFISNKRSYSTTQSSSRIQENARNAFEMLSRELREAGTIPCSHKLHIANVIRDATGNLQPGWWNQWTQDALKAEEPFGLQGYPETAAAPVARQAGTDAVVILSSIDQGIFVRSHNPTTAQIDLNQTDGLEAQDILLICDYKQASIFQATQIQPAANRLQHAAVGRNCTQALGLPVVCGGTPSPFSRKEYDEGARVTRLQASLWYVAENGRGGHSLFRQQMLRGTLPAREEIAEGVTNLQLTYLVSSGGTPSYQDAPANYAQATSVRVSLTIEDTETTGTNNQRITRQMTNVVSLRNRLS